MLAPDCSANGKREGRAWVRATRNDPLCAQSLMSGLARWPNKLLHCCHSEPLVMKPPFSQPAEVGSRIWTLARRKLILDLACERKEQYFIFIRPLQKVMPQHSVVVQTCPLSTRETEAELRLLGAQGQPDLYSKFQATQRYTVRLKKKKSDVKCKTHFL